MLIQNYIQSLIFNLYNGRWNLPVAFINNHPYFLFSREALIAKEDPGKWSDFGGSKEGKESHRETAIREGWEESNGFLGTKTNVKNLVKNSLIASIQGRGYVTFIVNVKYNKNIEQAFKDDFKEHVDSPDFDSDMALYEAQKKELDKGKADFQGVGQHTNQVVSSVQ